MYGVKPFDGVVVRMMARFGGIGILHVNSAPIYVDGESTSVRLDYELNTLIFDYPQNGAGDKANFNTSILEGDVQCFAQPLNKKQSVLVQPIVQANRDTITLGITEWKILNVKQLNPSGSDNVLYEFHLRK